MNFGLNRGVHAPAIVRPTYYPWKFGCAGDGRTGDTLNLQKFLDASAGAIGDFGGRNYAFNGRLYVRASTFLNGYGSQLTALVAAGNNSSSLNLTDNGQGTAPGPDNVTIAGLTIFGNAIARRAAGTLTTASGVGNAAAFYCIGVNHAHLRDCVASDSEGDGFYIGGDDRTIGLSHYFSMESCFSVSPSRNAFSAVGAKYGDFTGCIAINASFGQSVGNISYGWDFEPNTSDSQNSAVNCISCKAINCATIGFGINNTNGSNNNINWTSCYTESCGVGYYASAAGTGARLVGCRTLGNTTNYQNVGESISGFP